MVDKLEDCRIAAIEAIGSLKTPEPRIYQILIDGMDHEDPAIRYQCLQSLRMITRRTTASIPRLETRVEADPRGYDGETTAKVARRRPHRRKRSRPKPSSDRIESIVSARDGPAACDVR